MIERKVFTKSPIPPPPPRLTSKSSNSIINKTNQRVKSMYIDNNNSKIEKETKIPESSTASNSIQKSNTSDFLVKPSNPNSGNAIKRYKTNKYSNMYRRDKRTNSVNIESLNFRFGNLETNSERQPAENKLSIKEREFGAGGASGPNSDYENRNETSDVPDQSEWEKLSENQKTNESMIEGLKKQIDSLSKQLEHIGKEDSKIINDLSEQVEHLAKMNYVSCITLLPFFFNFFYNKKK